MNGPALRAAIATAFALAFALPADGGQATLYWNAQWGRPQSASAGLGVLVGRTRGESLRTMTRALLLEARPGLDGGAFHVGFAPFAATTKGFPFAGVALKGTLLRTWGTPSASLKPRQTYAGAELHLAWIVKGSVGVLWRISGAGGSSHVLTWSVGVGL